MIRTAETSQPAEEGSAHRRDAVTATVVSVFTLLLMGSLGSLLFREPSANVSLKERFPLVIIQWGMPFFAVVFAAVLGPFLWLARKRAVEQGGELLRASAPVSIPLDSRIPRCLGALLCTYPVFFFLKTPSAADWMSFASYLIFFVAVLVHDLSGMSLSHVEFRDHGIVLGAQFLPWEKSRARFGLEIEANCGYGFPASDSLNIDSTRP